MADDATRENGARDGAACAGTTQDGRACPIGERLLRFDEQTGQHWCISHDPSPEAQEALKVGRLRGALTTQRKLRTRQALTEEELGALETPEDAARWSRIIAVAAATGRLSPSQARAVTTAVREFVKSRDLGIREERLAKLERQVATLTTGGRAR